MLAHSIFQLLHGANIRTTEKKLYIKNFIKFNLFTISVIKKEHLFLRNQGLSAPWFQQKIIANGFLTRKTLILDAKEKSLFILIFTTCKLDIDDLCVWILWLITYDSHNLWLITYKSYFTEEDSLELNWMLL